MKTHEMYDGQIIRTTMNDYFRFNNEDRTLEVYVIHSARFERADYRAYREFVDKLMLGAMEDYTGEYKEPEAKPKPRKGLFGRLKEALNE